MGVMYGKVRDGTFWIMDAAALPVEGTETRVNAGDQVSSCGTCLTDTATEQRTLGNGVYGPVPRIEPSDRQKPAVERMVSLVSFPVSESGIAQAENASRHPGYGCWLSGIDVNTQQNNQKFNDPYLAVVVRPCFI